MSGTTAGGLAPAKVTALLEAALQRLHVELTSPDLVRVGAPVTASIVGAQAELDVSDLLDGILDVGWLDYSALAGGDLAGDRDHVAALKQDVAPDGMPGPNATALTSTVSNAAELGRLVGVLGVPRLRVRVDIRWHLRDHAGRDLVAGQDFLAPAGIASPSVTVLIPPIFQDLTQERMLRPPTRLEACPYYLSVHVALSIGSASVQADLPAPSGGHHHPAPVEQPQTPAGIPLFALPLPIPTLVAMFSNPHFDPYMPAPGFVMVVVPHHSPVGSLEHLNRTLQKIDQQVADLRDLPSFAGSLLGIDTLSSALDGQPGVRLARARPVAADDEYPPGYFDNALQEIGSHTDELPQGVPYFEDVTYYQKAERIAWISYDSDSVDFDDAARSLIMLGLPGTQATFFNDYYYNVQKEPAWSLHIPEQLDVAHDPLSLLPFAIVPRLSELKGDWGDTPVSLRPPETIPPGRAWVSGNPGRRESWGGQMGSMWFDNLGLAMGCGGIGTPTGPTKPPVATS